MTVIIVMGLPGCGKSYFAERLATALGAVYINSDRIRKTMISSRTYSLEEKLSVYNEMLNQMQLSVKENESVVLDGTFYKHSIRRMFIQKAKRAGGIIFIEVRAAESLIQERLQHKRMDSEADFKVYHIIKSQWEPLGEKHLIVQSTKDNITDMLLTAIDYLQYKNDKRAN
jgi:predicted kinase